MERAADLIGRLNLEWIAIKAGLKPANRITIAPERAEELEARARHEGFFVARGARVVEFPGRPAAVVLYLSPDAERARELVDAEAPLLPPASSRLRLHEAVLLHARLGRLLGFPPCCVDAFGTRLRRGVTRRLGGRDAHEDFVAAECAAQGSHRFLGRLNDLSPDRHVRIVTFYPCRYDCPRAAGYSSGVFAAAERSSPAATAALRTALLGTVSIATDGSRGQADQLRGELLTLEFSEF